MTQKQDSARKQRWKEELKQVLAEDRDVSKQVMQEALQQVLEGGMDEALQAGKGERTANRLGDRSGHDSRTRPTEREGVGDGADGKVRPRGVTRQVKAVTEELCRHEFRSPAISRMVQTLAEEPQKFAGRRLEEPCARKAACTARPC